MDTKNLVCLVGVAALASCGKSEPKVESLPSAGQIVASVASRATAEVPAGIAIYPGAQTLMASHLLTSDKSGAMYDSAFKSGDKPETVADFYRNELTRLAVTKARLLNSPWVRALCTSLGASGVPSCISL